MYNIGYKWKNGAASIGQDNLQYGYGISGNIILSGKAPSFPYVRLDYRPWKWLHFNYFHGWLHSNIIDSTRSYNTGSGVVDSRRDVYRPKFLASHAITVHPIKGLDISLGESVVYGDNLNIGYLIPISLFKAYDHYISRYNIRAGNNAQFFGFVSSRNHLKNTHLYAQLFIDEIAISKVLNRQLRRNQWGYTIGLNRTDLFLHYLTAGVEYSRVNPFVYNNLIPAETYESHSYVLGDWMGNNADRLFFFLDYTPIPRLKLRAWHQTVRKGAAGTLEQQYFQSPQPPFLFARLFDLSETSGSVSYEWINKLRVFLQAGRSTLKPYNGRKTSNKNFTVGVSYGL
ncbi:MAG TPA: capsule assembly Wzi family protein [Chitinophagaceae bacterium]|nr:capsule assembly Wzi family protein [Chitinophagaceae bacterium]